MPLLNRSQQEMRKRNKKWKQMTWGKLFHKSSLAIAELKHELMGIWNLNQKHGPLSVVIQTTHKSLHKIKYYNFW
jgi:hypothetical protein